MEEKRQWSVGTVVYYPELGGFPEKWCKISSVQKVSGENANGGHAWLEVCLDDDRPGQGTSPHWMRRQNVKLPGEAGYKDPPSEGRGENGSDEEAIDGKAS